MTTLVNIPISGRDRNTLFEISFNHCPPRLQKIWFVSSALQSNTFNFTATTSVGKHTAAQAESPTFCYFGELPKHNYCFGRNRTRKDFSSFGKTEFRPKWPNFGQNGRNSAESRNRICFGRTLFHEHHGSKFCFFKSDSSPSLCNYLLILNREPL